MSDTNKIICKIRSVDFLQSLMAEMTALESEDLCNCAVLGVL